jgi:PAS domain S-box-containing protein
MGVVTTTATLDPRDAEVQRLRRSMNDLLSVLALPALWTGNESSEIVKTLAEALRGMLALDLVYVSLDSSNGDAAPAAVLASPDLDVSDNASTIDRQLQALFGERRERWPATARGRLGSKDLKFSNAHLGLGRDLGVIVAAAARADFPTAQDMLVLNVSANEVALAIRESRLRDEQKRIAEHLDRSVAQRTRELTAANAALEREVAERQRIEEALQESAFRARAAIDGIPGLVAILSADGAVETVNRQILDYCGATLEELRDWGTNGIVHPEDLAQLLEIFTPSVAAGLSYQIEQRLRRHDGVYRWFDNRGIPVRDARGRVDRWYVLLTDVEDRKRVEILLAGEKQLLEMIASGRPLRDVLGALCTVVEDAAPDCLCDIHPIDWNGPTIAYSIAPSLPPSYTDPIAGTPLRADVVPCGIAANENTQVISEDFDVDPRWCAAPVRNHVLDHGLRSVWSTPIRSKTGGVLGTLCIYQRQRATPSLHHQDIIGRATHIASIAIERLEAEDELRRSQASLADAQHISLTGSFSWLVDNDIHSSSEQLRRIFELDDGIHVTFARMIERIHPDDVPLLLETREQLRHRRDNPEYEIRLLMPDGRIKHARVFARTIQQTDGRLECIGAVQDVTRQRQAGDALNKVRSDLAHVTRVMSLGTLAASIAHEVNQPLSGIITNANTCLRMLASDPPNVDGAVETARRTIRDGNRASEVIARLRALFRKSDLANETVDIHQAAVEVIALTHQDLRRHRVNVQTDFADATLLVTGDRVQLQQVILNLLLNAAESLKAIDDRDRQIVVRTVVRDDIQVSVRDNGVGLTPDQAAKVFDAFFTTKADGMGIGLSVSQSIIERHAGRMWAEPNEDGGATFSFSLPLRERRA